MYFYGIVNSDCYLLHATESDMYFIAGFLIKRSVINK